MGKANTQLEYRVQYRYCTCMDTYNKTHVRKDVQSALRSGNGGNKHYILNCIILRRLSKRNGV